MIGKTIDRYKIVDKLGEGGMGSVWKAEDTKLNRLVALKTLSPHLAENEEARERFVREAQAASALNHPNITTVHDLLDADDQHFICMEYVEGKTVRDMVESGRVGVKKAVDIILQVAEALSTAHRKGILHRDIKSANIMVSMEGNVKVMDFGLAHLEERSQLTRTGTTMGTLAYSSPEQLTGYPYDERSEIWSLGVVFYEMLTGQLPFQSPSEGELVFSIVNNEQPPPSTVRENLPPSIDDLAIRMLEKDPEARYGDCAKLISDLRQIRSILDTSTSSKTVISPRKTVSIGSPFYITAAVVVVLAIVVLLNPFSNRIRLNPHKVVIYDPVDQSSDQSLGAMGAQLANMLYSRIRQTGFLEPSDFSSTSPASRILKDRILLGESIEPVQTLAREFKAGIAISGDLFLDGDRLECSLRITDCTKTEVFPLEPVAGTLSQRNQVLEECATLILVELARRFNPEYQSEWSRIISTTQNLEAQQLFYEGLYNWRAAHPDIALENFLQAATLDSTFHSAQLWAARQSTVFGLSIEADSLLQLLEPHKDTFSPIEQIMFDNVAAKAQGDLEEVYRSAMRAHRLEPGSIWTWEAGQAARICLRFWEARELFEQLDPAGTAINGATNYWTQFGSILWGLEDYRALIRLVRKSKTFPNVNQQAILVYEMAANAGLGRIDDLIPLVDGLLFERPDLWGWLNWIFAVLQQQGYEDDAILIGERMLEHLKNRPEEEKRTISYRIKLANTYYRLQEYDQARQIWLPLHAEYPIPVSNRELWYGAYLGTIAARENDLVKVREIIQWLNELEAPELSPHEIPYALACIYALLGEPDQAVHYLRESHHKGRMLWNSLWDPDLVPLRKYHPYREFMGLNRN